MKSKTFKIILILLLIGAICYLISKFPDYSIFILGVAVIIIIGLWMLQANKEEYV